MATTKSTVVGIRLDHERRAWVEAEAARLGVSVRGLFEGMIDEARAEESESAAHVAMIPGSATDPAAMTSTVAASDQEERMKTGAPSSVDAESPPPRRTPAAPSVPGLGLVTGIPGGIARGAFSLTANLIEASGRCAANRLVSCALTRRWVDRPL